MLIPHVRGFTASLETQVLKVRKVDFEDDTKTAAIAFDSARKQVPFKGLVEVLQPRPALDEQNHGQCPRHLLNEFHGWVIAGATSRQKRPQIRIKSCQLEWAS